MFWLVAAIAFVSFAVIVLIICDYFIIKELTNVVNNLSDEIKDFHEHTVKELRLTRYHIGEVEKKVKK